MIHLAQLFVEIRGKESQADMAIRCGLSRATISRIERGTSKKHIGLRIETIRKIRDAYNLPRTKYLELLEAWIRYELGDDFHNFDIHHLQSNLKESTNILTQITASASDLSKDDQRLILAVSTKPELRKAVKAVLTALK